MNNTDKNPQLYGPSIPPDLKIISRVTEAHINRYTIFGPQLQTITCESSGISDNMNVEVVGPLPSTDGKDPPTASEVELSTRALKIKLKNIEDVTNPKNNDTPREKWMLELPEIKCNQNLVPVPRSFQIKDRPDYTDRAIWTDIPSTSSKKKKTLPNKDTYKRNIGMRKDKDQDALAKKYKTKRDKSLLQLHEEKYQTEGKKNQTKIERRPFNREIDTKVTYFDQRKKSALVKNAQLLDTKFSSGKTKYL